MPATHKVTTYFLDDLGDPWPAATYVMETADQDEVLADIRDTLDHHPDAYKIKVRLADGRKLTIKLRGAK